MEENSQFQFILEPDSSMPAKCNFDIFIQNKEGKLSCPIELYEFSNSDDKKYLIASIDIPLGKEITKLKLALDIDANGVITLFLKHENGHSTRIQLNSNTAKL